MKTYLLYPLIFLGLWAFFAYVAYREVIRLVPPGVTQIMVRI